MDFMILQKDDLTQLKITIVALTNVMIWALAWTPYAVTTFLACFGDKSLVSGNYHIVSETKS